MDDTQPGNPDAPRAQSALGPYRLAGVLAKGGMGVVYRGEHVETGEAVALKTVHAPREDQLAGIRREIHALCRLRHPGIVRILADGVTEGRPWYAMPLLQGRTLAQHLTSLRGLRTGGAGSSPGSADLLSRTAPVSDPLGARSRAAAEPRQRAPRPALGPLLTLLRRLCAPLAYLHGEGLIHRDLKPSNVFLEGDGRPVLVDLGIAVRFGGARGREELDVEPISGTPAYMAPEQFRGELVDARADLYALGCILYECVTGQPPFIGETFSSVRDQHLYERPLPPSIRVPGLPAALDRLVLQLLEKHLQDRMGYAVDVAAALADLGAEPPPEDGPRPQVYLYRPELTGRAEAMAALKEAVERVACDRCGGLVLLRGESGVGKTRLAMELARIAAPRLTVITGRCAALGAGAAAGPRAVAPPLHPFRPVLLAAADRALHGGEAAPQWLTPQAKVLSVYEPALLHLPAQKHQPEPPQLPPEEARKRVIASLREVLWALAERSPLAVLLDDLQWADELSLSLLESLAQAGHDGRGVLVVGTYRVEETRPELEALARSPGVTTITLPRLDALSVRDMVSGMLALRTPPRSVLGALLGHSNGNPFFVAEYLRAAIDEGMLRRDESGSFCFDARGGAAAALSSLPLPPTLAELLEQRLGRLDAAGRALLAWGAVLGQELDGELLAAGGGDHGAEDAIEALRALQILEEAPGGQLRFVHDKIREIAYERTPEAERIALHRRAGDALEVRYAGAPDLAQTLAYHYAKAGVHGKAGRNFAHAADRAREMHVNGDAIRFYRSALAELTQAPPDEVENLATLQERLGDTLALVGRQAEARGAFEAALAAAPSSSPLDRARLHRKVGNAWDTQKQHVEALNSYAQAEAALAGRASDRAGHWRDAWLQIQLDRVEVYYSLADFERMRERIEAIRPIVKRSGVTAQHGRFLLAQMQMSIQRERYVASARTVRWARDGLAAFEATGEETWILTARCSLATILLLRGAFDEAEEQMTASLREAVRLGDLGMQSRCLTYLTLIQRRLRRVGAAGPLAEQGLAVSRAAQMTQYIGASLGNLAWSDLERGHHEAAERVAREALSLWEPLSLVYPFQWLARMPLARVELDRDRIEAAMEQVRAMLDSRQQRLPDSLASRLRAYPGRPAD